MRYLPSKPKEPLLTYNVPTRLWQKVGTYLFQWANKNYLIIVDYYSMWPEVFPLSNTNSINVILACKESFSRNGVPEELASDNGTQYTSKLFYQCSQQRKFRHTVSISHYPRSNGLAEATIKLVKLIVKKCHLSNEEIFKGIFILRNFPI
nr:uncharacterized protein K02A2.6-like [Hydra vulgaris]